MRAHHIYEDRKCDIVILGDILTVFFFPEQKTDVDAHTQNYYQRTERL